MSSEEYLRAVSTLAALEEQSEAQLRSLREEAAALAQRSRLARSADQTRMDAARDRIAHAIGDSRQSLTVIGLDIPRPATITLGAPPESPDVALSLAESLALEAAELATQQNASGAEVRRLEGEAAKLRTEAEVAARAAEAAAEAERLELVRRQHERALAAERAEQERHEAERIARERAEAERRRMASRRRMVIIAVLALAALLMMIVL